MNSSRGTVIERASANHPIIPVENPYPGKEHSIEPAVYDPDQFQKRLASFDDGDGDELVSVK
ncbi:hypothetical protein, partial [Escherichia coli]|uniref:hypothetical protein n=1 Tax=Escherichia coli TaxID=562 RepID=UPI0019667228